MIIIIINLIYLFLGSDQLTLIFNVSDAQNIFIYSGFLSLFWKIWMLIFPVDVLAEGV